MSNKTMMQYFSWDLPDDGTHWKNTKNDAAHLARLGITDVWLPPAYKGNGGAGDVGYGVYDLYDLGEFDQKGSTRTKYGTKDEYLAAIRSLQDQGIRVLADVVLNHRIGADYPEDTTGTKYNEGDRLTALIKDKKIKVWTGFNFPGRNGKYSVFCWNKRHFSSVDWDQNTQRRGKVYKLAGHRFSRKVANEFGNYDYLMGADVDFSVPEVREELRSWGKWYLETTGADGFRLDAVKHISFYFYREWLKYMRSLTDKELYAVGEYWRDDVNDLMAYLKYTRRCMDLFDVTLHYQFYRAAKMEKRADFDLRCIFDNTILSRDPDHAVTFVDNHDSQPNQALKSWVQQWFKPHAYALILLWDKGFPCVFHGDLYGIPAQNIPAVPELEGLLLARKDYAYGPLTPYFDHSNVVGWTREGSEKGGMAVVLSNGLDGWKDMKIGQPGQVFVDLLGKRTHQVIIDENGWGRFTVSPESVSVWIPKN